MRLVSRQVEDLVWNAEVERIEGLNRRWSRTITSIVKMEDGKFYSLDWEQGLTENQDDFYPEQEAHEVTLVEEERLVKVKEWVRVG